MGSELRAMWKLCGGDAPEEWSFTTIESLLEDSRNSLAVGVMYPGKNTIEGVPLVKVSDVKNGRVIGKPDFLISSQKDEEYKRTRLFGNELLITLVGNPGDCALVTEDMAEWNVARAIAVLRLKDHGMREWVRLALLSHPAQHFMNSRFNTTVQRTLNLKDIREIAVPIPPENVREGITKLASALDDKIELNRKMNETLESMSRALFKSWFVDFDPVLDKALSAGNPIPEPLSARAETRRALAGQTQPLPAHIQKLFPDAFMFDEEHGWMPEGWKIDSLSNLIDFMEGPGIRNWQYTEREDGCRFINIRCIKNGDLSLSTANKITMEEAFGKYSHFQLAEDDIVISTSGTLGRFAFVRAEHLPLSLNTSVIRFRPISGVSTIHYIAGYCATRLQWELETRASGSVQRNFGPMHLNKITMLAPAIELLEAHAKSVDPLFRKGQFNLKRIETLTKLRDTLLPQLLSGSLRIPDAEQLVADSL